MAGNKSKIILKLNLKGTELALRAYLNKTMARVAFYLEGVVKSSLVNSSNGGRTPSSPGQAPHVLTGALRSSITGKVVNGSGHVSSIYGVSVGTASAYAKRLELGFYGTDSKGRKYNQAPRPFLKPAYQNNRRKIKQIIRGK